MPNGGEVVLDNPLNDFPQAVEALRCMHVSYLNAEHDLNVLCKWEQAVYEGEEEAYRGMDGLSYVDRHLGYRFVVRGAQVKTEGWLRKTAALTVEVENVGFAPRYTPGRVEIVFRPEEGGEPVVTEAETDVRGWKPGETVRISAEAPEGIGRYEVFLRAVGGQNGRTHSVCKRGDACGRRRVARRAHERKRRAFLMKVKDGFLLRQVAGAWMAVPVGERLAQVRGLISLNETGASILAAA